MMMMAMIDALTKSLSGTGVPSPISATRAISEAGVLSTVSDASGLSTVSEASGLSTVSEAGGLSTAIATSRIGTWLGGAGDTLALAAGGLNVSGWLMMILAVGGVTGFFAWCLFRVLSSRESAAHIHSPSDIDTHDHED